MRRHRLFYLACPHIRVTASPESHSLLTTVIEGPEIREAVPPESRLLVPAIRLWGRRPHDREVRERGAGEGIA